LKKQLEDRNRELAEAREQQAATSEVETTRTTPTVFVQVSDPVTAGAHPVPRPKG
jgi:hypothetical protein